HIERELLLQRSGDQGFPNQPRPPRRSDRIHADADGAAWRYDLSILSGDAPESRVTRLDLRNTGWEARAISGGAGRIASLALPTLRQRAVRRSPSPTHRRRLRRRQPRPERRRTSRPVRASRPPLRRREASRAGSGELWQLL